MTLHVRPHRSLAALTLLLAACTGQPQPLEKPLAPELALPGGLRVVLLDADLPAVADTVRLAVGKTLDVKVPDWPLPTAANGQYSGFTTAAPLDALALTWSTPQHLRLTATLGKMAGGFSLVQTGQAGCGLTWQVDGGSVQLEAEVVRQSDASLAVQLSGAPVATWEGASVSDASACLAKLPPADASSPGDAILAEVTQQLAKRLSAAFLPTVSRVFAASLEQSGRLATVGSVDPAVETRFALKYVEDAAHVALHSGASAQASLAVSVDADRHPCAVDAVPVALVTVRVHVLKYQVSGVYDAPLKVCNGSEFGVRKQRLVLGVKHVSKPLVAHRRQYGKREYVGVVAVSNSNDVLSVPPAEWCE